MNYYFIFFSFICLFGFNESSKLEIFNNGSKLIYEINTPPLSQGNLDFPVSGLTVFGKGCDAFNQISESDINKVWNSSSSSKLIAIIDFTGGGCFLADFVFRCQTKDWCGGILLRERFFNPAGLNALISFRKKYPRSDFKVPFVEASDEDFIFIKNMIIEAQNNDQHSQLTLIGNENPWIGMFQSTIFFVTLRVLAPFSSCGCLILVSRLIWIQAKKLSLESEVLTKSKFRINLKLVCLSFHFISQLTRTVFFADPFQCQQIYSYTVFILLLAGALAFEISTSILLSFLIRELVHAVRPMDMVKATKFAYYVIVIFLACQIFASVVEGLRLYDTEVSSFQILGLFYSITNFSLGVWYFKQSYVFLKRFRITEKAIRKENLKRISLTQLSLTSSIGMILISVTILSIGFREIFGRVWGYFATYLLLVIFLQTTSFLQILLFGGVIFKFKRKLTRPSTVDL
eukprot:c19479_g1_i1.p1 GENE.c19479_g1_i1~~c19479_g1_i1.p1  ORF type:complete len:459 (-),score=54.41 c19479_g1_i1:40-1416(-)